MDLVGIDACKGGWIVIGRRYYGGDIHSVVIEEISDLYGVFPRPKVVGIDIPVGLTEQGPRDCDRLARKLLGFPRSSSVFPAPIRPALHALSREEASEINQAVDGRGVGPYAWGLYPRVLEVDQFLQANPQAQDKFFEVHPELAFLGLNNGLPITASKKTTEGRSLRMDLINGQFGSQSYKRVRAQFPRGTVRDDDILDAFAVLWSAERIQKQRHQVVPDPPDVDATGLKMGIWF